MPSKYGRSTGAHASVGIVNVSVVAKGIDQIDKQLEEVFNKPRDINFDVEDLKRQIYEELGGAKSKISEMQNKSQSSGSTRAQMDDPRSGWLDAVAKYERISEQINNALKQNSAITDVSELAQKLRQAINLDVSMPEIDGESISGVVKDLKEFNAEEEKAIKQMKELVGYMKDAGFKSGFGDFSLSPLPDDVDSLKQGIEYLEEIIELRKLLEQNRSIPNLDVYNTDDLESVVGSMKTNYRNVQYNQDYGSNRFIDQQTVNDIIKRARNNTYREFDYSKEDIDYISDIISEIDQAFELNGRDYLFDDNGLNQDSELRELYSHFKELHDRQIDAERSFEKIKSLITAIEGLGFDFENPSNSYGVSDEDWERITYRLETLEERIRQLRSDFYDTDVPLEEKYTQINLDELYGQRQPYIDEQASNISETVTDNVEPIEIGIAIKEDAKEVLQSQLTELFGGAYKLTDNQLKKLTLSFNDLLENVTQGESNIGEALDNITGEQIDKFANKFTKITSKKITPNLNIDASKFSEGDVQTAAVNLVARLQASLQNAIGTVGVETKVETTPEELKKDVEDISKQADPEITVDVKPTRKHKKKTDNDQIGMFDETPAEPVVIEFAEQIDATDDLIKKGKELADAKEEIAKATEDVTEAIQKETDAQEKSVKARDPDFQKAVDDMYVNNTGKDFEHAISETAKQSSNAIEEEGKKLEETGKKADEAANKKKKFSDANKEVKKSAEESAEAMDEEGKAAEKLKPKVEPSSGFDKERYVTDADGTGLSYQNQRTNKALTNYHTVVNRYGYDEETGELQLQSITDIFDYKKLIKEAETEQKKIEQGQKNYAKAIAAIKNKTLNQQESFSSYHIADNNGNAIALEDFEIKNIDDLDKAAGYLAAFDAEWNNVQASIRKGSSSLNPFVNAINNSKDIFAQAQQSLDKLGKLDQTSSVAGATAEISDAVARLHEYVDDQGNLVNGKSIQDFANAYGDLKQKLRDTGAVISAEYKAEQNQEETYRNTISLLKTIYDLREKIARLDPNDNRIGPMSQELLGLEAQIDEGQIGSVLSTENYNNVVNYRDQREFELAAIKQNIEDQETLNDLKKEQQKSDRENQAQYKTLLTERIRLFKEYYTLLAKVELLTGSEADATGKRIETLRDRLQGNYSALYSNPNFNPNDLFVKNSDIETDAQQKQDIKQAHNETAKRQTELNNLYKQQLDLVEKIARAQYAVNDEAPSKSREVARAELEAAQAKYDANQALIEQSSASGGYADLHNAEQQTADIAKRRLETEQAITFEKKQQAAKELEQAQKRRETVGANFERTNKDLANRYGQLDASDNGTWQKYLEQYEKYVNAFDVVKNQDIPADGALVTLEKETAALKNAEQEAKKYITTRERLFNTSISLGYEPTEYPGDATQRDSVIQEMTAQLNQSFGKGNVTVHGYDETLNKLYFTARTASGEFANLTMNIDATTGKMYVAQQKSTQLGAAFDRLVYGVSHAGKQLLMVAGINLSFNGLINTARKGIQYVKNIDTALTELKKVTDETEQTYSRFIHTTSASGTEIGSTISDFTQATADFARLGYSINEAADMAKSAIVFKNVGDGIDTVNKASEDIIATMSAFPDEMNNTMAIVDKYNEVLASLLIW